MNFIRLALCLATITSLTACNSNEARDGRFVSNGANPTEAKEIASGTLKSRTGLPNGSVKLIELDGRFKLSIDAQGIPSGPHGFHLHAVGGCEAPSFASAGGHLNPMSKAHGKLAEGGSHLGDLPNLIAKADGTASTTVPLEVEAQNLIEWLFDEDGTAIVIHETADDYITNPSGAAGARISCAVLTRS